MDDLDAFGLPATSLLTERKTQVEIDLSYTLRVIWCSKCVYSSENE
jgi:hypothetical protein